VRFAWKTWAAAGAGDSQVACWFQVPGSNQVVGWLRSAWLDSARS